MSTPYARPVAAPATEKQHPAPDDPMPRALVGPGWYESTWDLISGLEVTEVLNADQDDRRRAASVEWLSAPA